MQKEILKNVLLGLEAALIIVLAVGLFIASKKPALVQAEEKEAPMVITEGANIPRELKNVYYDDMITFEYPKKYTLSANNATVLSLSTSSGALDYRLSVHKAAFANLKFKTLEESCAAAAKEGDDGCVTPSYPQDKWIETKKTIEGASNGAKVSVPAFAYGVLHGEIMTVNGKNVLVALDRSHQAILTTAYAITYRNNGDEVGLSMGMDGIGIEEAQQDHRWLEFKEIIKTLKVQ